MDKRLIATGVLVFFLGMLTGYLPALAFPGKPNPGHSASEIGAGTFGEAGDYVFPAGSRVGIGTAPSYNLDVAGDIRWTGTLQGGSIPWARLTNFPSGCPAGQYVSGIGGTLTCSSPTGIRETTILNENTACNGGRCCVVGNFQLTVAMACFQAGYIYGTYSANIAGPGPCFRAEENPAPGDNGWSWVADSSNWMGEIRCFR
jgi:hypothetical protein